MNTFNLLGRPCPLPHPDKRLPVFIPIGYSFRELITKSDLNPAVCDQLSAFSAQPPFPTVRNIRFFSIRGTNTLSGDCGLPHQSSPYNLIVPLLFPGNNYLAGDIQSAIKNQQSKNYNFLPPSPYSSFTILHSSFQNSVL